MKTLLLFLLALTISTQNLKAEKLSGQAELDSLLAEVPKAKGDTNEVKLLIELSISIASKNFTKGLEYAEKGLVLAKKLESISLEASCYNNFGNIYKLKSEYDKAMEYYRLALLANKRISNRSGIALSLERIGGVHLLQADYPGALENYQKALKLYEEIDNKEGIVLINGSIGIIYTLQSNDNKALEYYQIALKLSKELNDKYNTIRNLRSIGGIYLERDDFPMALKYFDESLTLSKEIKDKNGIAMTLGSIALIFTEQSDYAKALEYYEKALKLNQEIGKLRGIAYDYLSLGDLYYNISQDTLLKNIKSDSNFINLDEEKILNKSIGYLLEAQKLYKKMSTLNELSRTYNTLHKAYYKKGMYKKSIDAHINFKELQDSIFSKENNVKMAALEKAREDDVNRIKIEKQEVQLAAQESEKMYIIYSGIGIISFVIAILALIAFQRKKSDKLLYNVLPISIAKRLKKKEHPISDHFDQASIIFIDIVGFTAMSKDSDPTDIVQALNKVFTHYDSIASKHGLEKIKTIGDCYMAAAGIPVIQKDNTLRAARMAIEVRDYMVDYYTDHGFKLDVRIGLDCGPVVAGVIGEKKFIYDMWSDAVNTASRMESTGQSGSVHISERFKEAVDEFDEFEFIDRGEMEVKGKGKMKTFFMGSKKLEV